MLFAFFLFISTGIITGAYSNSYCSTPLSKDSQGAVYATVLSAYDATWSVVNTERFHGCLALKDGRAAYELYLDLKRPQSAPPIRDTPSPSHKSRKKKRPQSEPSLDFPMPLSVSPKSSKEKICKTYYAELEEERLIKIEQLKSTNPSLLLLFPNIELVHPAPADAPSYHITLCYDDRYKGKLDGICSELNHDISPSKALTNYKEHLPKELTAIDIIKYSRFLNVELDFKGPHADLPPLTKPLHIAIAKMDPHQEIKWLETFESNLRKAIAGLEAGGITIPPKETVCHKGR